jgi:hypothetical protein
VIPGTSLTYEDARGYIAVARYDFRFLEATPGPLKKIQGCPKTREIAERLGYGAIEVEVDSKRQLVLQVDYRGLGGNALKRYQMVGATVLEGHAFPASVLLEHWADGLENRITYEYWSPGPALSPELFRPDIAKGSYLERMRQLLAQIGLGDRVEAEIA